MVLTIIGWAQVIKAFTSFVVPQLSMRSLQRVSPDRANEFVYTGVVFILLSALMAYVALSRRLDRPTTRAGRRKPAPPRL